MRLITWNVNGLRTFMNCESITLYSPGPAATLRVRPLAWQGSISRPTGLRTVVDEMNLAYRSPR